MYQVAAISGHILTPVNTQSCHQKRPPTVSTGQADDDLQPPSTEPASKRVRTDSPTTTATTTVQDLSIEPPPASVRSTLRKCTTCQACFLSPAGLTQHVREAHQASASTGDPPTVTTKRGRPAGEDTVTKLPREHTTDILVPVQEFECPLRFETLGRKAIAAHLRSTHQIDKPGSFPFRSSVDMYPGRLSCMHCKASFTMAFPIKNHFDRGTCPVLLLNWVRDAQYGPPIQLCQESPAP